MTLDVLGPDDPALDALRQALARHPEWETGLTIVPWPEYRQCLMAALTSERAPYQAVCVPGHVWIPELVDAGYLASVDSLLGGVSRDIIDGYMPQDIMPLIARESHYRGHQYMVPLFSDGHVLFYRKDLVTLPDGDGVPIVSPQALGALAAKAHRPPEVYGLALKAHPSEIFLDWLPFLWGEGGDIFDDEGQPAFASEAGVRALATYCDLRHFCPPDTHTYGNAEIAGALKSGRVAMATTWGGQAAAIVLASDGTHSDRLGTAVYSRPWNATWGVAIPANQPVALQERVLSILLQAMGPDTDRKVTRVAGSPVRRSSYSPTEMTRYVWLRSQHEMLSRADMLPMHPQMGSLLEVLYPAVYAAFVGEATPRQALSRAEADVRPILSARA